MELGNVTRELIEIDLENIKNGYNPQVLVVGVRLPTGAVETIVNYNDIPSKLCYYLDNYDNNMRLISNSKVKIEGYMLI